MIDVRLTELAKTQDDLLGIWQLKGWTPAQIQHRTAGLERVMVGVVRLGRAPLTQRQRWRAATLSTPDSVLSHASSAAYEGYWTDPKTRQIITRPGNGGPEQIGTLLVLRSSCLADEDI